MSPKRSDPGTVIFKIFDIFKKGPRQAQDRPKARARWPKIGPKRPKTGPRHAQDRPKTGARWPKIGLRPPKMAPGWFKRVPRWPKTDPRQG